MTNRKNPEGYLDMTAYYAIRAVERTRSACRPLVYIASPFAGDVKRNVGRAREFCRFAVNMGAIPIAPHLLFPQFMDDNIQEQRKLGLQFALTLMAKCAEVWVFGTNISDGMAAEIEQAEQRGMTVRYFTSGCREVRA